MGARDKDPGREIDRAVHPGGRALPNTSPVYGVHNSAASKATKLTDGTPTTATSQWGSHEKDATTKAFKAPVPARIDDTPGRPIEFVGQTYEHTFESTAIALEGPIPANTYLGSVSWGWKNDDLVLDHKWASPFIPVPAIAATLNGGNYTVTLRFDK